MENAYGKLWFDTTPRLTPDQISDIVDDHVAFWHDNDTGVTLQQWLDMTDAQYALWVNHPDRLYDGTNPVLTLY